MLPHLRPIKCMRELMDSFYYFINVFYILTNKILFHPAGMMHVCNVLRAAPKKAIIHWVNKWTFSAPQRTCSISNKSTHKNNTNINGRKCNSLINISFLTWLMRFYQNSQQVYQVTSTNTFGYLLCLTFSSLQIRL